MDVPGTSSLAGAPVGKWPWWNGVVQATANAVITKVYDLEVSRLP